MTDVPPLSKRLRLSRNRHVCTGGTSGKTTPLESLDLQNTFDQLHHLHFDQQQQQQRAGAEELLGKDKQPVSDGSSPKAFHTNQRARGASSTCCGESSGKDSSLHSDDVDISQPRVHVRDPEPSEQPQPLGDKPAVECTTSASNKGPEQAFSSYVSHCQPVETDAGEEKEEELGKAQSDDRSPKDHDEGGGGRGGGTRGQEEEGLLESQTREITRNSFANSNIVVGHAVQTQVTVDNARGSRIPPDHRKLILCSTYDRPAAENVVDGDAAASSSPREVTPVEGDSSSLELVHQIVRDLQMVHQMTREENDHPSAPESSSRELGRSTDAALEPEHGSPCELHVSTEENTSLSRTGEIPDANEGFPESQHQITESGLDPVRTELAFEGRLPFASTRPRVEFTGAGALTSNEENRIAEDVDANMLTRSGDLVDTNEVQSPDSQQMITEDQVTRWSDSIHTSLPSEGRLLPGVNQQVVGSRVEIIEATEEEDISAREVVNILARTGRIVRAIENYSRSPDHGTTEDHVDAGVSVFNTGLQPEVQVTSRPNQQMVERAGELLESSREVTAEDVANIYTQAGAIAQAASNWFAQSESARNRAIENINMNANWGSLVQENVTREPEILVENTSFDHKRPDEGAEQVLQTQEKNATDGLSCPICMEPWTNTGEHRICSLACGHLFGKSCIKRWIKQSGRRMGKCPHCNKRAKVEDLRNIYVPQIAVTDGQGHEAVQEVKRLKSENEEVKRMNSELHLEMARLPLEMERLRHIQAMGVGAGILQKVEHNRFDEPVKRQASLQTFFGRNDRRRSRRNSDEHRLERHSKVQTASLGHRSSSSLACIGNHGIGKKFTLQDEIHLLGAKVFDMEDHSQVALVSNKGSNHGNTFGLTKISLLTLSEVQHVSLPTGLGAIRDVRFSPFGVGAPGNLALVASLGKRLSLFSLDSNAIVLDYPLQSAPWSCAWDSGVPNQVYAGLQNGSLLIFDLRQTSSPLASFPGYSTRPVHTLQAVQSQSRKGILSASNSGAYFWDMGTSASFTEIQRPLCISDDHREKLCVSLAYAPGLKTAVASFRPSPLAQTEAFSSVLAASQADGTSEPCGTLRRSLEPSWSSTQQTPTQDNPSHCVFNSRFVDSSSSESTDEGKGSRREWRWQAGRAMMVGHKSISVMPRSAIIVEPVDDLGLRASFACGDEGSNAVWLWDMNTLNVTQTLVPHQSPVLDVKYVNIGESVLMGCISERTFQLYLRSSTG